MTEGRVRSFEVGSAARGPRAALALVAAALVFAGVPARAQDAAPAEAAASGEDEPAFTAEQLEQMLAPLALYPDDLLSQILMASTYPLEIVQADRWVKVHKDLAPGEAEKALEAEDWDPSVKSLVAVPDVLALLSDELDWTQQLGDAFISQQADVLATVQTLRGRAKENGHLESNQDQNVEVDGEGSTQTIVIESAQPDVIYVPVYDTTVVYGYWPYPAYPPYYYYPPAWHVGTAIVVGFAWGYAWGHCDWHGGDVDIDINRNVDRNRSIDRARYKGDGSGLRDGKGAWQHDARHRGSVPYRDSKTAKRYDGITDKQAKASRDSFRGRSDSASPRVIKGGSEGGAGSRAPAAKTADRGQTIRDSSSSGRTGASSKPSKASSGSRSGGLDGVDRGGKQVKRDSSRGQASRSRSSPSRSSYSGSRGGGRGMSRGGGGRGR